MSLNDLTSLDMLLEGEEAEVVMLVGGRGLVTRLAEMGITPGTRIRIVRRIGNRGPVEVYVRGSILALGWGIARKIMVKRVS
ncbi:MAG: FeoA family protein [Candidatus Bathyarchaeia archaeon]